MNLEKGLSARLANDRRVSRAIEGVNNQFAMEKIAMRHKGVSLTEVINPFEGSFLVYAEKFLDRFMRIHDADRYPYALRPAELSEFEQYIFFGESNRLSKLAALVLEDEKRSQSLEGLYLQRHLWERWANEVAQQLTPAQLQEVSETLGSWQSADAAAPWWKKLLCIVHIRTP